MNAQGDNKDKPKDKDSFDWKGEKYGKNDSYERLTGLAKELRNNKKERLPVEDYQLLRGWIENRDRERFSGVLEKELQHQIKMEGKRGADAIEYGTRYVDPVQAQVVKNPVIGVVTGRDICPIFYRDKCPTFCRAICAADICMAPKNPDSKLGKSHGIRYLMWYQRTFGLRAICLTNYRDKCPNLAAPWAELRLGSRHRLLYRRVLLASCTNSAVTRETELILQTRLISA